MSTLEIVAVIIGIFFVVGILVGVLLVVALPVLRSLLWERRRRREAVGRGQWKPTSRNDDDTRPPRWPGA
jgi:hypothetical protein